MGDVHPALLACEDTAVETPDGVLPYIDAAIAPLIRAMNAVPGIHTISCCSGHRTAQAYVQFQAPEQGKFFQALLAYFQNHIDWRHSLTHTRHLCGEYPDHYTLMFAGWGETEEAIYHHYCEERDALVSIAERHAGHFTPTN